MGRIQSHRALAETLARSNLYISAARSEGMPVSILEAFFSKTAVISTKIPELKDFIRKKFLLSSFHPGNYYELFEGIKFAISNPDALTESQELAFKYAKRKASWADTISKVNDLNNKIMSFKRK